jgi:hypothetical protein
VAISRNPKAEVRGPKEGRRPKSEVAARRCWDAESCAIMVGGGARNYLRVSQRVESGRGLPHSKTLRVFGGVGERTGVSDCLGPLALWDAFAQAILRCHPGCPQQAGSSDCLKRQRRGLFGLRISAFFRRSEFGLRTSLLCVVASSLLALSSAVEDKVTYQDHILPLVEANCSKCHNADKKKADLELTSYQGALKGSGSGAVLVSGNLDGSKLWKAITHAEEPNMPPNRPKLADKELEVFKKWILGGLLETAGGKAIAAAAPAVDLTLKADTVGKPDGPPPMPKDLPLGPAVHTDRMNAITGLAASPWAPLVAVAGQKQVLLFEGDTLAPLGILSFSEGQPVEVKFSRSGRVLLASGGRGAQSGRVVLWDVVTGKKMMTLGDDYDTVLAADIRPDQAQVALGGPSRLVKLWSTKTGQLQHKIKKHTDWVTAVAFSPNGQMLATADRNGGISIWDPESAQELFTLGDHKLSVTALSWRGDSKLLASSSEDGTVKLWEMQEGRQMKNWTAHGGGVLCVNFAHDGQLVTCGRDFAITVWNANGGKERNLEFGGELPIRVVFSCDDQRVFATDFAGRVTVWTVKDGKPAGELNANPIPHLVAGATVR